MKHFLTAAVALGLSLSGAIAGDYSDNWTKDGVPVFGVAAGETKAPVAHEDKAAWEHARQTYERVTAEGGCNADVIPTEIAGYCFNKAINRTNPNGPIGASDGGE